MVRRDFGDALTTSNSARTDRQARLPATARVRDGTKDWILVVELNNDDVPSLVKYCVR